MQGNDLIKGNTCFGNMQKKSVIDVVFGDIIGSVLNDPELVDEIGLLQKESCELLDLVDQNKPVFIDQKAIEQEKQPEQKRDYNKYDNLFLNEQFKDVT